MQGRLRDLSGHLVPSKDRADTLAEYNYAKVQWTSPVAASAVVMPAPPLGQTLSIDIGTVSLQELGEVIARLKKRKGCGPDNIPAEFWVVLGKHQEKRREPAGPQRAAH